MTDPKPLSPIERINNMNALQAGVRFENMRATVWDNYAHALQTFLQNVAYNQSPYNVVYLQYPFFYFYLKEPKKRDSAICTIADFQYGNQYKSHIITRKTFPYFLQNQCMLPKLPDIVIDPMFRALDQLIRTYPRTALNTLFDHLKSSDPQLAAFLALPKTVCLSKEGNLYINNAAIPQNFAPYLPMPFQSVLELQWPNIPAKLLQKVFKELTAELSSNVDGHIENEAARYDHTVVFGTNTTGSSFIRVQYQPNSDSFEISMHNWPNFQLKHFPLHAHFSGKPVSDALCSFFRVLCGDSMAAVDALSCFLSRAMDPALPGMTIIYTKQHQEQLLAVLSKLFEDSRAGLDLKPRKNGASALPSLNQLTRVSALKQLFVAQSNSKSIVFIRDLVVSEGNFKVLRRLLKGTKITLRSSYLPPQNYYNKLHMICVSDNLTRARALQKQFKSVNLIDLSICEETRELPELSDRDYDWMRSTLLLYGLKLRTLAKEQLPDPASRVKSEPLPNLTSEIAEFLGRCERREGLHCDTFRLYDGFVRFYKSRHCGSDPETTKIKFNKEVRLMIDTHYGKSVAYRKIRTPHMVGWHYVGMDLPNDPPPPFQEKPPKLAEYLSHINTYALSNNFEPVHSVRVIRPFPDVKD